MSTNISYEILRAQSVYQIPVNEIRTRHDIYEFYKDAILGLNEAYQYAQTQLPLPYRTLPVPPIEHYQREIDRIFDC